MMNEQERRLDGLKNWLRLKADKDGHCLSKEEIGRVAIALLPYYPVRGKWELKYWKDLFGTKVTHMRVHNIYFD